MSVFDRLHRSVRGFAARITVELVRADEPPPPPPPPSVAVLPAPGRPRRRRGRAGYGALYGQQVAPDPWASGRTLGQGPAHDMALIRDQASAWRTGGPDTSAYRLDRDALHAEYFPPPSPGGSSGSSPSGGSSSHTAHRFQQVSGPISGGCARDPHGRWCRRACR
jgi:hypothetical protein